MKAQTVISNTKSVCRFCVCSDKNILTKSNIHSHVIFGHVDKPSLTAIALTKKLQRRLNKTHSPNFHQNMSRLASIHMVQKRNPYKRFIFTNIVCMCLSLLNGSNNIKKRKRNTENKIKISGIDDLFLSTYFYIIIFFLVSLHLFFCNDYSVILLCHCSKQTSERHRERE